MITEGATIKKLPLSEMGGQKGMRCPHCNGTHLLASTTIPFVGGTFRYRECRECKRKWITKEYFVREVDVRANQQSLVDTL